MKLLTSQELLKATNIDIPGGIIVANAIMQIFRYNDINKVYSSIYNEDPEIFIDSILKQLDVKFDLPEKDLKNIPLSGPIITISNHPFGGIDSLILIKILLSCRSDFKIMGNFLLQRVEPLKEFILPVNPFETRKEVKSSFMGLKAGISYTKESHLVSVFPAGEVSTYQADINTITDREWQKSALKFIKNAEVPVIPIYFHGSNSRWFYILAGIHPLLRTAKLPSELLNKKNKTVQIRIGKQISIKEQSEISDISRYGRYLRARTYSLGSNMEVKRFFTKPGKRYVKKVKAIPAPCDKEILLKEIESIRKTFELFTVNNQSAFFAPADAIPNIITEIGRLREITFRSAGEGTNKPIDIDEFDLYFYHLILWDNNAGKIIGSYRVGKGKEILNQYGIKGFYISTLFKINHEFSSYVEHSLELGRSFIVEEYQKKPLSLYLLWKGLITVFLKNPDYRYLIGPVSISNNFSEFSKSMIVKFVKRNYYDPGLAKFIKPKKKYKLKTHKNVDINILLENANDKFQLLEKVISDVDMGLKMPILLKKYLEANARIIGFNVDPHFNNCLDGLMILDMFDFPDELVNSLLREEYDEAVLTKIATLKCIIPEKL